MDKGESDSVGKCCSRNCRKRERSTSKSKYIDGHCNEKKIGKKGDSDIA